MNRGRLCNRWSKNRQGSSIGNINRRNAGRKGAELVLASALVVAAGSHHASASTASWIGATSADFSTNANWSLAGGISGVTGANLQFGATGNANPINDLTSQTWTSITFLSGAQAFDLTGNGFTLSVGSATSIVNSSTMLQTIDLPVILAGGRTIDASAGAISIADGLSGTSGADFGVNGSLTTPGPTANSTVILNSAATYTTTSGSTPATNVFSGTLQIGSGGSLPFVSVANVDNGFVALGSAAGASSPANFGVLELGDSSTPINQTINKLSVASSAAAGSAVVGGNVATSTLTIDYLVTGSDSFSGALGGAGTNQNDLALVITGGNTVSLSGATNSYTGGTTIAQGTLQLAANGAIPASTSVAFGDISNDNGTLDLDGHTLTPSGLSVVGSGTGNTIENSSSSLGKIIFTGTGSPSTYSGAIVNGPGTGGVSLQLSGGTLALSGSNTYSKGTTLDSGLLIASSGSLGTGQVILDGGTLEYASGNTQDVSTIQTLTLAINGGTVNTNSNNVTFASPIVPALSNGGFTKAGAGTLTLSAVNTYPKTTTVSGGTLVIGTTGSIASTAVSISSSAAMTVNGSINTATAMTDNGTLNSNVPKLEVISLNGAGGVNLNASELQVDNGGSFSGPITDSNTGGSLAVTAGLLSLSGSNSYIGATNVNGGTLVNNGDLATTAVAVAAGAVLAGNSTSVTTGTFGGTVSVDGLIAPGSSGAATGTTGTMDFLSDLDFSGASAAYDCDVENAGSASDSLSVAGNLSLGTGTALNINVIDSASGSTYTIATYNGTLTGTFASVNNLPPGYSINYGTGSDSAITLVVPEPASLSVLAGMSTLLVLRRRNTRISENNGQN